MPKTIQDLTTEESNRALEHFRRAVRARQTQWDHERCIEKLLGREINIDFADYAAGCDTPSTLSLNDLIEALNDENPNEYEVTKQ